MTPNIFSIIVAYYPKVDTFLSLVEALVGQTTKVIVVDNTDGPHTPRLEQATATYRLRDQLTLIKLGENRGIATAINIGATAAINAGCTHLLLSDQDSLPDSHMVANLIYAYKNISSTGIKVGAVGPTYTDLHTKITYPFQVEQPKHFFYSHQSPTASKPYVEALTLITSGTLIPVEVFRDVGPMRDDFFIDHVDIEWCHRSRSKGYHLFGIGHATMYQRMGESYLRVWYLGWRNESAYQPLRIYYRLRNFITLCRLNYISLRWKIRSSWYWTGILYAHVLFGSKRLESLKMAIKGIRDGLIKKMGRYEE